MNTGKNSEPLRGAPDAAAIRRALLGWYRRSHRRLPWRETTDPYRIWVSEIMLQQTQVPKVVPYYTRWFEFFPGVRELAAASPERVLRMWEGLGYYSRARNLHRAARLVVEKHGGRFPETLEEAAALPGIGRSTAGAILSIGYSRKTPVLDANVKRVLCRVFAVEDAGSPREIERKLWRIAGDLVRCRRPGDLNQGLMEVGSQVCAPRSPRCGSCPLKRRCGAFRSGDPELYALPVRRPRTERFRVALGIVFKGDKVLIQRRPEKGLLGGLWEFPGGKVEPGERVEQALHRELREELGVEVRILKTRETLEHHYTRFRVTLHPFDCGIVSGRPLLGGTNRRRWCPVSRLAAYAFPAANRRLILRLLSERGG